MKRLALTVLLISALAVPALAGVGTLGIYADLQGESCALVSYGGGAFLQAPVVAKFGPGDGSTFAAFDVSVPASVSLVGFDCPRCGISEQPPDTGYSVAYGECLNTTTAIGVLQFLSLTASPACSLIELIAAPQRATPLAADCSFVELPLAVSPGVFNPDSSCQCALATEPTSWGRVKALYH